MDDTVLKLLVLRELLSQSSDDSSSSSSSKNVLLAVGLKVVRGPDWKWENQDGGEGHVGTVVEVGSSGGTLDKQVFVVWDGGIRGNYRIGYSSSYDLRTLDNGSIGVHHPTVTCNSCRKKGVIGMRWKCKICHDYDLCNRCYMSDKHDITHPFIRIQLNNGQNVDVPKRQGAVKIPVRGIFSSAKVVRGQDWRWERQDGGPGRHGIVTDICGWDDDTDWNACHVSWSTTESSNMYRIGHEGKVDLKYIEDATDGYYYRDHLPVLGDEFRAVKESAITRVKEPYERRNSEPVSRVENRINIKETGSYTDFFLLCKNLENLYTSGQLCDFIIKVRDQEFPIHKAILAAHSSVFMSMFQHDMKEKVTGTTDITDCDPGVFADFLHYLYSGSTEKISSSNVIDLYEVSEKYDVQSLKNSCIQIMKEIMSTDFICDVLRLLTKYRDEELTDFTTRFFLLNAHPIILTVKWQNFVTDYPIVANELYIKAFSYRNETIINF